MNNWLILVHIMTIILSLVDTLRTVRYGCLTSKKQRTSRRKTFSCVPTCNLTRAVVRRLVAASAFGLAVRPAAGMISLMLASLSAAHGAFVSLCRSAAFVACESIHRNKKVVCQYKYNPYLNHPHYTPSITSLHQADEALNVSGPLYCSDWPRPLMRGRHSKK